MIHHSHLYMSSDFVNSYHNDDCDCDEDEEEEDIDVIGWIKGKPQQDNIGKTNINKTNKHSYKDSDVFSTQSYVIYLYIKPNEHCFCCS